MKPHILLVTSLVLVLTLFGSSQVQSTAGQSLSHPQVSQPDSLVFTFKIPAPQMKPDSDRTALPSLEGYEAAGATGDPLLPVKTFNIALPPDVVPESVKAQVIAVQTVELDGDYQIAPAPPSKTRVNDQEVVLWGKNAASIVDGKNTQVYQSDAYFPQSQLSSVRFDQMRKWRFVSLLLTPLQYNPVTGKLRLASEVQVQITFEHAASIDQRQRQIELSDTVMDERAAQLLYNYDQAQAWYPVMAKPDGLATTYDYVIITTNFIVANNNNLNSFKAHKEAQGYHVLIVTEDDYGGLTGDWPNRMAQKIRQWLKNNYQAMSIEYVLLIGDPTPYDPDNPASPVGAVPMRMCWPAHRYLDPTFQPLGQNIPTDYLYADLTGNWDLNSHGSAEEYCGELTDDEGPSGMSFSPEVYVGRIPINYKNFMWQVILDYILNKTILYEDSDDLTWRDQALLPMSFLDKTTDGAYLAEWMKNNYLNAAGYNSYTLYQHYSKGIPGLQDPCWSVFSSNQELVDQAVRDHWQNNAYGIVTWWGHGDIASAKIGYGTCSTGNILRKSDASKLDSTGTHPAIVFAVSEENGHPEGNDNLADNLLLKGAIATISSSRNSFYTPGSFAPSRPAANNASMAYYIMQRVVSGETVGQALYDEINQMSQLGNWTTDKVANWLTFNLEGDPSLSIKDHHTDAPNAPSGLTATPVVGGIKLAWTDNSDNEKGFVIERGFSSGGPWMQKYTPGVNATEQIDPNLSCGTHYYYRIQAYNAHGGSSYTDPADALTAKLDDYESDNSYSDAKFIISSGSGSGGQTHTFHAAGDVDWIKFNATWGKTYTISTTNLGANNDTYLELYNTNGTQKLAENDDCTPGSLSSCITPWGALSTGVFYIKVTHLSSEGGCSGYEYDLAVKEGDWADWPTQPTELIATPISHCQIDLSWVPSGFGEQGYEIERFGWKAQGNGYGMYLWKKIATVGAGVTNYSDSGLECDKTYPYRVRAYNANGKSFYTTASATTFVDDVYESDNTYSAASAIVVNGDPQFHNFHTAGDQDWVKFTAVAGQVYTITTSSLGSVNDTELKLYDKNGTTQLAYNDDCATLESCIKKWVAPSDGVYYVQVYNFQGQGGCPGYQYTLSVTGASNTTSLKGPSGLYFSDWAVSTLLLTWPDANAYTTPHAFQVERWEVITGTRGLWRQVGITGPGSSLLSRPEGAGSAMPDAGNSTFIDTGLTCNTHYSYRVRAFDTLGDTAYSGVISATTLITDTYEPDDVIGQASSIEVNGAPQDRNLAPGLDYDWFYFTAQAGEVYTITTSQFIHSETPTPNLSIYHGGGYLTTNEQCEDDPRALCINGWTAQYNDIYYLLVRGQGGCPGHDYSVRIANSHLSESWPAPPTVFTGTLTLPDQIDLTWADNSTPIDHLGFRLERLAGLGWLQIANLGYNVTSYSDSGLACGQPYQYRLFAYNDSGNSAYVGPVKLSTPACVYPLVNPLYLPSVRR